MTAMIMATNAIPAYLFALEILKPFSTIVMTSGTSDMHIPIPQLIFSGLTIIGTKNGTADDLQKATDLCVKFGIQSKVKTFAFGQEGIDRLCKEVHEEDWAGKAVVVM
jgi:D-arabinose 1-dehydrogenase-like Zn-dependent alcohol dehydrogenase